MTKCSDCGYEAEECLIVFNANIYDEDSNLIESRAFEISRECEPISDAIRWFNSSPDKDKAFMQVFMGCGYDNCVLTYSHF